MNPSTPTTTTANMSIISNTNNNNMDENNNVPTISVRIRKRTLDGLTTLNNTLPNSNTNSPSNTNNKKNLTIIQSPTATSNNTTTVDSTLSRSMTLSTASIFFFTAFIWHSTLLPTFYNAVGPELASRISLLGSHLDAFKDPETLDPRILRDFGVAGAASHTIVFLFGLLCATMLRTLRFSSIVRSRGGKPEPIGIGVSLVLVVWTASVFHVLAQAFSRYAFETRFGPVYNYATLFFKTTGGQSPFAWASSVSFTTALLMGFIVSSPENSVRFEKLFLGPFHSTFQGGRGTLIASIVIPFCIWLGLLDRFLIPTSHAVLAQSPASSQDDLVHGGHAFAFAVGLVMMVAGSATKAMTDACCGDVPDLTVKRTSATAPQAPATNTTTTATTTTTTTTNDDNNNNIIVIPSKRRSSSESDYAKTFDSSQVLRTIQTLASTMLLSSTLLASALFKGDVATLSVIVETVWRPFVVAGIVIAFAVFLTIKLEHFNMVDFIWGLPKPLRKLTQAVLILCLWNCHLVPFVGCWIPFHVFSYLAPKIIPFENFNYSQLDALWDGFLYAFTGPYFAPVILQGFVKIMSTRLKVKWGLVQESIIAVAVIVPPTLTVWWRWHHNHVALPVQLFMSAAELLYLLTWRARPEYTGWRDWPELKTSRIWWLIQDYFSVRFIVDGGNDDGAVPLIDTGFYPENQPPPSKCVDRNHALKGFEPGRGRIIGFHPHGLYPCTVVWQHLIPRWGEVFGKLFPIQLTDAFTHLPPSMRECQQWSGGREITRNVMVELLGNGETVIICPGGQSELVMHTFEDIEAHKISFCAKHRGFIRVALETGADIVPMISFGETVAIENIRLLPWVQKFFRKTFGAPVPFLPVGIGGILPFPRKVKFTLVYGQPINLKKASTSSSQDVSNNNNNTSNSSSSSSVISPPTDEEVDELYRIYFKSINALFEKYKKTAGYEDWQLVLKGFDSVPNLEMVKKSKSFKN
jgi:hypothetical protein